MLMDEFRTWFSKMFLNFDEGNLREALYCSDMALYSAERTQNEPPHEDLGKVYLLRGSILDRLGKSKEAVHCFRIVEDLKGF